MVATRSWIGVRWSRAQWASGYSSARAAMTFCARRRTAGVGFMRRILRTAGILACEPMAPKREPPTAADVIVTALSPVLIMGLVGSLVFLLAEVFYAGQYENRLLYTLFFF